MKYVFANLHIVLHKLDKFWNKDSEEHRLIVIASCVGEIIYVGCTCDAAFWEKELDGRRNKSLGRDEYRQGA